MQNYKENLQYHLYLKIKLYNTLMIQMKKQLWNIVNYYKVIIKFRKISKYKFLKCHILVSFKLSLTEYYRSLKIIL